MDITEILKDILKGPIERAEFHIALFRLIKKNKGEEVARDFRNKYDEIVRNQGTDAAMKYQSNRMKELGISLMSPPVTPFRIIKVEGDKVMIELIVRDPFQETEEEYNERKKG